MKTKVTALLLAMALMVFFTGCVSADQNEDSKANASVFDEVSSGTDQMEEQDSSTFSGNEGAGSSTGSSSSSETDASGNSGSSSSSSKPGTSGNSGSSSSSSKPGASGNSGSSSSSSKPGNSGNSGSSSSSSKPSGGNSSSSHTATSKPTAKPTPKPTKKPAVHTHHFVDLGVEALDWTYSGQENTGPANTKEKVSAVNACLGCGYFYGKDSDLFAQRYYDHIWGPDAGSCGGAYTLANVYACYHLLQCSDPSCGIYKRGELAYYEYPIYFDGNGNPPTEFILTNDQIQELGLPMP